MDGTCAVGERKKILKLTARAVDGRNTMVRRAILFMALLSCFVSRATSCCSSATRCCMRL